MARDGAQRGDRRVGLGVVRVVLCPVHRPLGGAQLVRDARRHVAEPAAGTTIAPIPHRAVVVAAVR
jgi:hypothetical protein